MHFISCVFQILFSIEIRSIIGDYDIIHIPTVGLFVLELIDFADVKCILLMSVS